MSIRENRERLLTALRSPMPEGFVWDFTTGYEEILGGRRCGCAMGIALTLGVVREPTSDRMAAALALPKDVAEAIFAPNRTRNDRAAGYRVRYPDVTSEMVARKLARAFKRYPVEDGAW